MCMYHSLLLALIGVTIILIGLVKKKKLKFLYEYGPRKLIVIKLNINNP